MPNPKQHLVIVANEAYEGADPFRVATIKLNFANAISRFGFGEHVIVRDISIGDEQVSTSTIGFDDDTTDPSGLSLGNG